jgi:hypothetical protein
MKKVIALLFAILLTVTVVYAQKTWLGTSSDWNEASNWSPNGVPGSTDDVTIPATANDPTLSVNANTNALLLGTGATLTINANGVLYVKGAQNLSGLRINGALNNNGQILIDDLTGGSNLGIWIDANGSVNNRGSIMIGSSSGTGNTGILNLGNFTNGEDGSILIVNTGQNGIENGKPTINGNAVFVNRGYIGVGVEGAIPKNGIANATTFTNKKPGYIETANTSAFAIVNQGSFYNGHRLRLDAPPHMGLNNRAKGNVNSTLAEFVNANCATISLFGRILNSDKITNNGFFSLLSVSAPSVTGQLINNGVMAEADDYLPYGSGLVNNEMILRPVEAVHCGTIPSVFDLGSPIHLKITGVFTDFAATSPAGSYDRMGNTFSPAIGAGDYTLYVKIKDPANNCDAILPWKLNLLPAMPDAQCQDVSVSLNAQGIVQLDPNDIDAGSSDACGPVTLSVTPSTLTCDDLGSNGVVLHVKNSAGNVTSCNSTVTVSGNPCK